MSSVELIKTRSAKPQLTVIVATDAREGVRATLEGYRPQIEALGLQFEFVCVVDRRAADQLEDLKELAEEWEELTVIGQKPWAGDDAALAIGVRRTEGNLVLQLPGWPEIDETDIPRLFEALGQNDMSLAVRADRPQSGWQGQRTRMFSGIIRRLFGATISDPFCRARLMRRGPLEDASSFGVRQHFLPVIASQRGYSLSEANLRPASKERSGKSGYVFKPLGHISALLDVMTLYVVLTFLRRPLRFFGAIGLPIFLVGGVTAMALVFGRLFGDTALADRPLLIFAVMMLVLGIQIIAIGLVGEIIIFSGSRRMKQYDVQEIIGGSSETRQSAV